MTRLPVFSRENQELVTLPQSDNLWWFLITSSAYLKSLADDISSQKIDLNSVHWIGNVITLKDGVSRVAPRPTTTWLKTSFLSVFRNHFEVLRLSAVRY